MPRPVIATARLGVTKADIVSHMFACTHGAGKHAANTPVDVFATAQYEIVGLSHPIRRHHVTAVRLEVLSQGKPLAGDVRADIFHEVLQDSRNLPVDSTCLLRSLRTEHIFTCARSWRGEPRRDGI